MFEHVKTQYFKDVTFTQITLWIWHNSNKNPKRNFVELLKLILKLIWKNKCTRIDKEINEKNKMNKEGDCTLPGIKIFSKHMVIKIIYIHPKDQWNKNERVQEWAYVHKGKLVTHFRKIW